MVFLDGIERAVAGDTRPCAGGFALAFNPRRDNLHSLLFSMCIDHAVGGSLERALPALSSAVLSDSVYAGCRAQVSALRLKAQTSMKQAKEHEGVKEVANVE